MESLFLFFFLCLILIKLSFSSTLLKSINDPVLSARKRKLIDFKPFKTKITTTVDKESSFDLVLMNRFLFEFMYLEDPRAFSTQPASEFICLLTRILYNCPSDLVPWEQPCASRLHLNWHMQAFTFLFKGQFNQEIILDYLIFILERCEEAICDENSQRKIQSFLLSMSREFIARIAPDFLEVALKLLKTTEEEALELFKFHLKSSYCTNCGPKWLSILLKLVKKFPNPNIAYHHNLRVKNFNPTTIAGSTKKDLFMHFIPILRTLLFSGRDDWLEVLDADRELFEIYTLFHTGDMDDELPIGLCGLGIVNEMFRMSGINFSTESKMLRNKKIVERIFDALFLDFSVLKLVINFYASKSFFLFEAFLKYSQQSRGMCETELMQMFQYLLMNLKPEEFEDERYLSALISYKSVPESTWNALRSEFCNDLKAMFLIAKYENLQRALEGLSPPSTERVLNIFSKGDFALFADDRFDGTFIDGLAETLKYPFQLELMRIFLASSCGIPLDATYMSERVEEAFEWSEAVGFVNFHVERWARLQGHHGDFLRFNFVNQPR
jgi:hypothetical protein